MENGVNGEWEMGPNKWLGYYFALCIRLSSNQLEKGRLLNCGHYDVSIMNSKLDIP